MKNRASRGLKNVARKLNKLVEGYESCKHQITNRMDINYSYMQSSIPVEVLFTPNGCLLQPHFLNLPLKKI